MEYCAYCGNPVDQVSYAPCPRCGRPSNGAPPAVAKPGGGGSNAVIIIIGVIAGLLVLVAIIGILAAIAIPNLLTAMQRSKQKRTMADMRSMATAVEAYAADNNRYPESIDQASPKYIKVVPKLDGWGHAWEYQALTDDKGNPSYVIASGAKDGRMERDIKEALAQERATTNFDCDIVYSNGQFKEYSGRSATLMFCTKCGTSRPEGMSVCPNCGTAAPRFDQPPKIQNYLVTSILVTSAAVLLPESWPSFSPRRSTRSSPSATSRARRTRLEWRRPGHGSASAAAWPLVSAMRFSWRLALPAILALRCRRRRGDSLSLRPRRSRGSTRTVSSTTSRACSVPAAAPRGRCITCCTATSPAPSASTRMLFVGRAVRRPGRGFAPRVATASGWTGWRRLIVTVVWFVLRTVVLTRER